MLKSDFIHPEYDFSLKLIMNDSSEQYYSADWIGYFETLLSARIEKDEERKSYYF